MSHHLRLTAMVPVIAAAVVVAGCGRGNEFLEATPASTASLSPTLEPSHTPEPPTPTATPPPAKPGVVIPDQTKREQRTLAVAASEADLRNSRLVVYTDEIGSVQSGGRSYPVLDIVTYDLDAGRMVAVAHAGERGDFVYGAALAGRLLLVHYEDRIVVSGFDGSSQRVIFTVPPDTLIPQIAVSPDGTVVAVSVEPQDLMRVELSFLAFVEVGTGRELGRVSHDAFLAAGRGAPPGAIAVWGDNSAVEVYGIAHKGGGPRPTGTAYVDGRAAWYDYWLVKIARSGDRAAYSLGDTVYVCEGMVGASTGMRVLALPSRDELFTIVAEDAVVHGAVFSPDGTELLYATNPLKTRDGRRCYDLPDSTWHLRHTDGTVRDVIDMAALIRGWEGDRFVEGRCPDGADPRLPGGWSVDCSVSFSRVAGTLMFGGKDIDQVWDARILGFLEPAP